MKILLADDNTNLHLIVRMWLSREGHEVISAYNGAEALEKLKENRFDGLITDVNMPLVKGVELVRQVLRLPNRPRLIVMLTSRCDISQLKEDVNHTGVHYFNKPFSPAALAKLIEKLQKEIHNRHEHDKETNMANPA